MTYAIRLKESGPKISRDKTIMVVAATKKSLNSDKTQYLKIQSPKYKTRRNDAAQC